MLGEFHATNPRHLLEGGEMEMVALFRLYDRGEAGGHLPDAGGTLDQAAAMMDAFAVMMGAEAELSRQRQPQWG